jgi:ribonuclease BN (tRNA processing enzyme)
MHMRLVVVGSGDAFNSSGRRHSSYIVESNGTGRLMVDFGGTALSGLRALGVQPNDLSGLVFTHLHGDHVGGMPFFAIDALYESRRTAPLHIVGPVFTRVVITELLDLTYPGIRAEFEALPITLDEVQAGAVCEVAGFRVECFEGDHMRPPHRSLCFRISDRNGQSVAFSGDTRLCPGLFAAADGADLLVAECTRVAPPAGAHITLQDWPEALRRFRCRRILLTHLGEDVRQQASAFKAATASPIPFDFADDGTIVDLARNY